MNDDSPDLQYECVLCGAPWPYSVAPDEDSECDTCGGEVEPVTNRRSEVMPVNDDSSLRDAIRDATIEAWKKEAAGQMSGLTNGQLEAAERYADRAAETAEAWFRNRAAHPSEQAITAAEEAIVQLAQQRVGEGHNYRWWTGLRDWYGSRLIPTYETKQIAKAALVAAGLVLTSEPEPGPNV